MGPPIAQSGKAHSFSVQHRTYNHAPRAIHGLRQPHMSDDSTPHTPDAAQPGTPSKPFMRVVKSYVLRTGRVGPGQQRAYEQFGPRFLLNYDASTLLDPVAAFGRPAPLIMEIGFGMGGATAQIAQVRPDDMFTSSGTRSSAAPRIVSIISERTASCSASVGSRS